MSEFRSVYITCADEQEARHIARAVLEERLAACANILGKVESLYWWQGQLEQDGEAALLLKTRADLVARLMELVRSRHSYEVPCIVAWPISEGDPDYLQWLSQETESSDER